jgi:hypothetical protein
MIIIDVIPSKGKLFSINKKERGWTSPSPSNGVD